MKFITAVISWITVIVLWKSLPAALKLPGLAKVNENLSVELGRRRAAEQKLASAHEEFQNLTSLVAHDLRNPLSSALMMADVVKTQASAAGASAISEQMEAVVLSLYKIKDSLKRFDLPAQENLASDESVSVDLNDVLKEMKTFLASSITANEARIESAVLPIVKGDHFKLFHLLTNLVENSIKYRGDDAPVIRIEATANNAWHQISISDNGRGIGNEDFERVFLPEYRSSNGLEEVGTGMGLSHCRRIVLSLGGTIAARPSESGGACFTFSIPVAHTER